MLQMLRAATPSLVPQDSRVILVEEPPAHCGFGSGTQLALAIAQAAHWQSQGKLGGIELATLMGRGQRSAVRTERIQQCLEGLEPADGRQLAVCQ